MMMSRTAVIAVGALMALCRAGESLAASPPTTRPSTVTFILHGIDSTSGGDALELDGLAALDEPADISDWGQRRLDWLKNSGVDVIADHGSHGFFLLGWGTTLAPVSNDMWDADPAWIKETLASPPAPASDWLHLQFTDSVTLPMTFAYRTYPGSTGLLRIVEMTHAPWSLKVQVRPASTQPARP